MSSLHKKLSVTLFLLLLMIGTLTWLLAQHTANRYSQEFYQRLNMPITMYMVGQRDFFKDGVVQHQALTELADLVMVVNPSLEIYLLDAQGNIVAHPFESGSLSRLSVDLAPIQAFLQRQDQNLLLADDPKSLSKQNIFSKGQHLEIGD